jgi:dihydrofolate reductase
MGIVRVGFSVSIDGFGAGPDQSLENPLGIRGEELHNWILKSRFFKQMIGADGGTEGVDNDYANRAMSGFGAYILGRNMYSHSRGAWTDDGWKGWWGDNPPYHAPTYILTHHPHDPIEMEGGTTFVFVTEGIEAALEMARSAAGDLDVKIGGGVSTVRQYLAAGLIDEMHFAVSPVVLGTGENLFAGFDLPEMGFRVTEHRMTDDAMHVVLSRLDSTST